MEFLRIENLCKFYGKGENQVIALDHVSLTVTKGEFIAIVGASGSGKSTRAGCVRTKPGASGHFSPPTDWHGISVPQLDSHTECGGKYNAAGFDGQAKG